MPYAVTAADVAELKKHGFTDAEVFDIAAAVAARAFFSSLCESLGVEAEASLLDDGCGFTKAMTVGRPIAQPGNGSATAHA